MSKVNENKIILSIYNSILIQSLFEIQENHILQ